MLHNKGPITDHFEAFFNRYDPQRDEASITKDFYLASPIILKNTFNSSILIVKNLFEGNIGSIGGVISIDN